MLPRGVGVKTKTTWGVGGGGQLRLSGKGDRPNKALGLTNDELEKFWSEKQLGNHSSEVLLRTVWLNGHYLLLDVLFTKVVPQKSTQQCRSVLWVERVWGLID